jgi:hypothetical protein
MEVTKMLIGSHQNVRPIPDRKTTNRKTTDEDSHHQALKFFTKKYNALAKETKKIKPVENIPVRTAESLTKQLVCLNLTDNEINTYLDKAFSSSFLKGEINDNWSMSLNWLFKGENYARVIAGKYDNFENKKINKSEIKSEIENNIRNLGRNGWEKAKETLSKESWGIVEKLGGWTKTCNMNSYDFEKQVGLLIYQA